MSFPSRHGRQGVQRGTTAPLEIIYLYKIINKLLFNLNNNIIQEPRLAILFCEPAEHDLLTK